jgi:hypothetical protein
MNKHFLLALPFIIFISKSSLLAQDELLANKIIQAKKDIKTYTIQSLEGKSVEVKVIPDYAHHILRIMYLTEKVTIADYWGVPPETSYLGKQFLKINYEVRGGSNFGLGNSLIICVSNNKLCEVLHVLRYTDWESELVKTYNVKFVLTNHEKNYQLIASIRDKSISAVNPQTNYDYTNISKLNFERTLKVFYSIKQNLYNNFKVVYPNITYKREIRGNFPEVILEDNKYIFIGGQWFELDNGTITKF